MLKYIPTNEQEVVTLFAYLSEKLGYTIKRVQTEFPDCFLIDKDGRELRAEFEFKSSHFYLHKHDITKCDMIIAWEDDIDLNSKICVLELRQHCPNLEENKDVAAQNKGATATEEGLLLIARGEADKEHLSALFGKYHLKEREKEPVRFIARLFTNGGDPYIKDGKIVLNKPLKTQQMKYSVSKDAVALNQARELLRQIGLDF